MNKPPIVLLIEKAGSQTEVARVLSITPQAVQQWFVSQKIPVSRCLEIEEKFGIPREQSRPDVFERNQSNE